MRLVKVKRDLTGMVFGRLTVIKQADDYINKKGKHQACWVCKCECGNDNHIVLGSNLTRKISPTQSCGCSKGELISLKSKVYNDYEVQSDYVIMYTQKGEPFYVDLEDFWKVKNICWHKRISDNYFEGHCGDDIVLLHRLIMNFPENQLVDHIGGEKSKNNNCKYNLRIGNKIQNGENRKLSSRNKSGYTGVSFDKRRNKWRARISLDGHEIALGYFTNLEEAIIARKDAENKYFGEWSYDNSQKLANSS